MKILIFGGTSEGRKLAFFCAEKHDVTLSVASNYGKDCANFPKTLVGRLESTEIYSLLKEQRFFCVIDATHPFATIAHENIKIACENAKIPFLRFCREKSNIETELQNFAEDKSKIKTFDSFEDLAKSVAQTSGNVFVATGCKNLPQIVKNVDAARLFVRVLPCEESLLLCRKCGIAQNRIIAMQGPFSFELNRALFLQTASRILITKLSGKNGGIDEKINAAKDCSMQIFAQNPPIALKIQSATKMSEVELWLKSLELQNQI